MRQGLLYQQSQEEENGGNFKVEKELQDLIKSEHMRKMWRYVNSVRRRQFGGITTAVDINVNGHWTHKGKQSEVEVGIMESNRNLTCRTPLVDVGHLHKYLGTLADTTSEYKVLSLKYYLPVDVGDNVEG